MTEDWFEDELPWLEPPLPPTPRPRERPQPAPHRRVPPRLSTSMPPRGASASAGAVPYPTPRVPLRLTNAAVPPQIRVPQRRYGEVVALKWAGVLLILVAALTAFALIVRDIRSDPGSTPLPTAQLVIPPANAGESGNADAAIVPNPAFQGKVICLDAAHGGIDRGFRRAGDSTAPAMDEALYTAA